MSVPLTINGALFNYPVNFDTNWGIDATGWAQAVTAGMLQKAGGSFPLTAEVDFGASFGVKSLYFKSRTANPSTVGTLRLASADPGVGFRNNANSGNLVITTDASDNLLYNGHVIAPSGAGTVTSISGTANEIIASSATGAVTLSTPQAIASTSSPTFAALTLTSPLSVANGGTGDASLTAYAVLTGGTTSTGAVQSIASVGLAGQVLTSNGAGALPSFTNATGTGTVNSGTTPNIAYYATTSSILSDSGISRANLFLADGTVSATGAFNLNSHKVTNLTNGSSAQDAVAFTQLSSGAAITTGGVASNTLTGSTANSGGSAGNVAQGTISTPDLRAHAVTQVQSSAAAGTNGSNSLTVTSQSITTIGGPVLVMAYATVSQTAGSGIGGIATVQRGTTNFNGNCCQANTNATSISGKTLFTIIAVDSPVAGTYTYNFFTDQTSASPSVVSYSLVLVELRA